MRGLFFALFFLLPFTTGCGDGLTGPEPARVPEDPSYIDPEHPFGLLLPAVQSAREAARRVETSSGTPYILTIQGTLYENGRALGFASLSDPDDPSRRFHYQFESGRAACVDGTPVAYYTGNGRAVSQDGTFTHRYGFGFTLEPIGGSPSEGPKMRWTWVETDPAGREGEYFVTEGSHLYFSPDICNPR